MAYKQNNNPYKVTSCGRRRNFMQGNNLPDDRTKTNPFKKLRKTTRGKGRHFLHAKEGAGMTAAGRAAYKKENPFVQDQKVGKVKEVKLQEEGGNVRQGYY